MGETLESLLTGYAAAWAENDPDVIAEYWAAAHFRFYKAEEIESVFHDWAAVIGYWRANREMHDSVRLDFAETVAMPLAGGWSLAFMTMTWRIRFAKGVHAGRAMGGDNRVLALLRETPEGLRLAGWSETPDAPISYIRRLYERQATLQAGSIA